MVGLSLLLFAGLAAADCEPPGGESLDVLDAVTSAVLLIERDQGHASGVVIDPNGAALTAAHVVGLNTVVLATFETGVTVPAIVVQVDHHLDIALLQLPGTRFPCASLARATPPRGTDLFAIGAPMLPELAFSVSKGIVSGYPVMGSRRVLQTDTDLQPGNSGGPLITADGQVVGIVTSRLIEEKLPGIGFAVPSDRVSLWLQSIEATPIADASQH